MKFPKSIAVLLIVFTLLNCSKNDDKDASANPTGNFTENFGNQVTRDFVGQVVNESSQPMEGVEIKIGAITQFTDSDGLFYIRNAAVYEKFAYVTAKKSGFINGSRTVVPNLGETDIKITMLTATVQSTIQSGASSNVSLANGAKVVFDGNFKTESGTAYSGNVKVIMHHLDPADETMFDKMPGSLMAQNSAGAQRILETYGMMNIELQDETGNKLQIVNPATIEMPISMDQLSTAPRTIPLWYFDEIAGYWKEEGSATKLGNKYIGTVNHFSWWNCDAPFPNITLSISVFNTQQLPLSGLRVDIKRGINGQVRGGYTNRAGQVSGLVPANELLTVLIYYGSGLCSTTVGALVYTQQIGPFSTNTTLPTIVVTPPTPAGAPYSTSVQGTVVNCNNEIILNGFARLMAAGSILYSPVVNGAFQFNVLTCTPEQRPFSIRCSAVGVVAVATAQGTINNGPVNLGVLQVCDVVIDPPDPVDPPQPDGNFSDLDQNNYTYVAIGQQTWMQQNLNVTRYSDGTVIPQVSDPSAWAGLTTGAWCYYSNNTAAGVTFGKLYNWYAAAGIHDNDPNTPNKSLAPTGWHVPTDAEWTTLTNFLGGEAVAGGKMKTPGNWQSPNTGATNSSGFTATPGGYRDNNGTFSSNGSLANWWSFTEFDAVSSWSRNVFYFGPNASRVSAPKARGFSVRCIRN